MIFCSNDVILNIGVSIKKSGSASLFRLLPTNIKQKIREDDCPILARAVNPLRANPTKWSNTLKQFVGILPTNCLSLFDYFVGLALKGLTAARTIKPNFITFLTNLTDFTLNLLSSPSDTVIWFPFSFLLFCCFMFSCLLCFFTCER